MRKYTTNNHEMQILRILYFPLKKLEPYFPHFNLNFEFEIQPSVLGIFIL